MIPLDVGRVCARRAFDVEVAGRVAVRIWGLERLSEGCDGPFTVTDIWMRYETAEWQPRAQAVRLFGQLVTDRDLHPLRYRTFGSDGSFVADVELRTGEVTATYADGTVLREEAGAADFLLPANAVPVLAAKVERLVAEGSLPYEGSFLSPETLQVMPYRIEWDTAGLSLRTSMEELLEIHDGQLVGLEHAAGAIRAVPMRRRRPSWPFRATRTPGRATSMPSYTAPAGVSVSDGATYSAKGSRVGYALAVPDHREAEAIALFCGGSGAHDRHGIAGELDLGYHQLLDGLCRWGVASLRFDKRGSGSTPLGSDILDYGFDDIVADARACFEIARGHRLPLVLIGHSEGALVALRLAVANADIAGIALLGASARPLSELVIEQTRARSSELGLPPEAVERRIAEFDEFLAYVRRLPPEEWRADVVPARVLAMRRLAPYYRQVLQVDACSLVRQLGSPLLVLHGAHDQQVPPADAAALERCARDGDVPVTAVILEWANHLLKSTSEEPTIADYYDRRRRVAREAVDVVGGWIADLVGTGRRDASYLAS